MKAPDNQNQNDALLQKLSQIMLNNLDNDQFGVETLSREVGMSRSHLHRKLKLLKGQSISQFIREIRLNEAMKLLQEDAATVSEIAYKVGFNSTSYFHKCFFDAYGYSPGEVKKRIHEYGSLNPLAVENEQNNGLILTLKKRKKMLLPTLVVAIGLVLFFLGRSFFNQTDTVRPRSIAVLPLKYIADNPEQEYLASGIHNGMISTLGQISSLKVISRNSTLRYKQSELSLTEIAKEMGVDAVIKGSVFGSGDSVHIQLKLIGDFPKEQQLWAKEYHHNLSNILTQHSDMVRNIAKEIHLTLTPQEKNQLAQTPSVHPAAYKAYLKGMFYWEKLTEEDLNTAEKYFELTLSIDPEYAPAYSGLSLVWVG